MDKRRPEDHLNFKPLSGGVGFHPFSDGLPYAPTHSQQKRPKHSPSQTRPQKELIRPAAPRPKAPKKIESTLVVQPGKGLSYVLKRSFAFVVDLIVNTTICVGTFSILMLYFELDFRVMFHTAELIHSAGFLLVFNWAVITAQEVTLKTTFGKKMFQLVIEGSTLRLFLRSFLFWLTLVSGTGLIAALFNKNRRCLHDFLTGVQPEEMAVL